MGMDIPHVVASGMGGIRAAGDLVARMMYAKNMRLNDAKDYVAKKLGVTPMDLGDECVMRDLREELKIGSVTGIPGAPRGILAKMNIENILDIKINSCEKFREKLRK